MGKPVSSGGRGGRSSSSGANQSKRAFSKNKQQRGGQPAPSRRAADGDGDDAGFAGNFVRLGGGDGGASDSEDQEFDLAGSDLDDSDDSDKED